MTTPDTNQATAPFSNPGTLFSRVTDQVSADLNGDMAVLSLQSKTYFGLTGVGAFIWQKLAMPIDLTNLVQAVVDEFEVEPTRCGADVVAFLQKLKKNGLLSISACSR